jgi:hypothetical protein
MPSESVYYCSMTNTNPAYATVRYFNNDTLVRVSRSPKPSRTILTALDRAASRVYAYAAEQVYRGNRVTLTETDTSVVLIFQGDTGTISILATAEPKA